MIRGISPSDQRFLNDLNRIQERAAQAQNQISSGLKVSTPSDAPDLVDGILQLRGEIARNQQINANLGRAKTEVDTAESVLESAVQLLDRAKVLAAQGASGTQTAEGRLATAGEVGAIHEHLLALSSTSVEGRFIFSGDQDQSPAYQLDLTNPNGVDRLLTASATRQIEDPGGSTFAISKTAQEIFDNRNPDDTLAPDNVFAAVNGLRAALENNDTAGIEAAISSLSQAAGHLNTELAYYGATQNRIQTATDFSNKLDIRWKAELSGKQDADLTSAILELKQSGIQQDAALAARTKLPQTSLFDFLK